MPGLVGGQLGQQLPDTNREQANSHQANKLRRRAFGCAADCLNRLYGVSYNCGVLGQAVAERLASFACEAANRKLQAQLWTPLPIDWRCPCCAALLRSGVDPVSWTRNP